MLAKDKSKLIYGASVTEAGSDAESYEPETHVNIPRESAIKDAKDWVDSNEK